MEQFEYIKNQLTYIKSKVELDNQLGLYDINKLGENIFMHILNDVYGWNLTNANLIEENFPAIDLIDDANKIVIQVTSTTSTDKLRTTIEKFRKLEKYVDYQLKIFYIKDKPNFQRTSLEEFAKNGVSVNDMLGIDDILKEIQADNTKCETLYKTIQQRMDSISFKFNIESYFNQFEPHLRTITSKKFEQYQPLFIEFIQSEQKVLEVHAVGGSGKSHLLKSFGTIETDYIPLVFTKQINIEEDLKKLDMSKKYLFIFDDIDRFLDQPILLSLLAYTIQHENIKLILSYRTASKHSLQAIYRKFGTIVKEELEIVWNEDEIKDLIKTLIPNVTAEKIRTLTHSFNHNPYLITQAIDGNIETIKDFSKKIIDDTRQGLLDFGMQEKDIIDLLFLLSLVTPISEHELVKYIDIDKDVIFRLEEMKIIRKLSSKYRFNPDIQGDLYLANYIDENKGQFEKKIEKLLPIFSEVLFTNLSYALLYSERDSLQDYIKRIIQKWIEKEEYNNHHLSLINKIANHAPEESFIYLQKATKVLKPKTTNTIGQEGMMSMIAYTVAPPDGDYNSDNDAINLESIEPIISTLIYMLKNGYDCGGLKISHIIQYLTSKEVIDLPKPYYDNQTLQSIFEKMVSPLYAHDFNVIYDALDIMEKWLDEPINNNKIILLQYVLQNLLSATFDDSHSEGFTYHFGQTALNVKHPDVIKTINKSKDILLKMLDYLDDNIVYYALDSIDNVGNHYNIKLSNESQKFYDDIRNELLEKVLIILNNGHKYFVVSKIEDVMIDILRHSHKNDIALKILENIDRHSEYVFYQMVKGVDFLIVDYPLFYKEYKESKNDINFWYDTQTKRRVNQEYNDLELGVIKDISLHCVAEKDFINLLNNLDMNSWNSHSSLMKLLGIWFENNNKVIDETCKKHIGEIHNIGIQNLLKEFALLHDILGIKLENITDKTSIDDLRVYINVIFKNYDSNQLEILKKIVAVIDKKSPDDIRMFISIISQNMYFILVDNDSFYEEFEPIIMQFLDWQLKYNFNVESYITHHILNDIAYSKYDISDEIKTRLKSIVKKDEIYIDTHELTPIYRVINYKLENILEDLYNKLIVKKDDGTYKHIFTHYFDHDKLTEVLIIKDYIRDYDDFLILIDKTLDYCNEPIESGKDEDEKDYELYIHLDYFLKYSIKKEYIEKLFGELHDSNDIEKIKKLYSIVPVSSEYMDVIVKNINFLHSEIDDAKLMNYLTRLGQIKSFSSAPMENSQELLDEEAFFRTLYDKIDWLSLQLKIKEELKYIEIEKRREIERDIAHLLGK